MSKRIFRFVGKEGVVVFRQNEKVVIVTGGVSGIGFATGRLFAQQGAKVLLVGLQKDSLCKAVEKIGLLSVSYAMADVPLRSMEGSIAIVFSIAR